MSDHLAELREAAHLAERAAWEAGIGPSDPLGRWVAAISLTMKALPLLLEERANTVLAEARALASAETDQLRAVVAKAAQLTQQLEYRSQIAVTVAESTQRVTAEQLVEKIATGNQVAMREAIDKTWVFTESRVHKRRQQKMGLFYGIGVIAMTILGYGTSQYETRRARFLLNHCETDPLLDQGRAFCLFVTGESVQPAPAAKGDN